MLLGLWWKPLLLQKGCPPSVPSLCGSLLFVTHLIRGSSRLIPALCIPSTSGEHLEDPWFAGVQLAWLCIGGVEMRSIQNRDGALLLETLSENNSFYKFFHLKRKYEALQKEELNQFLSKHAL